MAGQATEHACTLSHTNAGNVVATCRCGWIGAVHIAWTHTTESGASSRRVYVNAEADAIEEYKQHRKLSGPIRATLPPEQFAPLLINTRRFGHQ